MYGFSQLGWSIAAGGDTKACPSVAIKACDSDRSHPVATCDSRLRLELQEVRLVNPQRVSLRLVGAIRVRLVIASDCNLRFGDTEGYMYSRGYMHPRGCMYSREYTYPLGYLYPQG